MLLPPPPPLLLVPLATDLTLDTKELDINILELMTASSPTKDHMVSTNNSLEELAVLLLPLPLLLLVNKVPLLLLPLPLVEMPPLLLPLPLEEMPPLLLLPPHLVPAWDLSLDLEV